MEIRVWGIENFFWVGRVDQRVIRAGFCELGLGRDWATLSGREREKFVFFLNHPDPIMNFQWVNGFNPQPKLNLKKPIFYNTRRYFFIPLSANISARGRYIGPYRPKIISGKKISISSRFFIKSYIMAGKYQYTSWYLEHFRQVIKKLVGRFTLKWTSFEVWKFPMPCTPLLVEFLRLLQQQDKPTSQLLFKAKGKFPEAKWDIKDWCNPVHMWCCLLSRKDAHFRNEWLTILVIIMIRKDMTKGSIDSGYSEQSSKANLQINKWTYKYTAKYLGCYSLLLQPLTNFD